MEEKAGPKCERELLPWLPFVLVSVHPAVPSGKPWGVFECLGRGERHRALHGSPRTGTCVGDGHMGRTAPKWSGKEL